MKEFTVGQYKTREGFDAIVGFVFPCTNFRHNFLVGYVKGKKGNYVCHWYEDGRLEKGKDGRCDLMPNIKKIESWGFVYWHCGGRQHAEDDNEQSAIVLRNHFANVLGYPCSEVFKYPTLEVEE